MTWLEIMSACSETSTPDFHVSARVILENDSLHDVGDGMKSRIGCDMKTNDAEKTGNVPALQEVQKSVCSKSSAVVR